MLTNEEMLGIQAEKHDLININKYKTKEEYVLHLIHSFAYFQSLRFAKDRVILDLGCNTGYGSEILSKTAKKVVGVDVSKNAISIAKKKYDHLNIEFQQIDGKKLPFDDNEFDLIVSFQVIEHIVDYSVFINELKRVLKPNGIVVFTTPNARLRLNPGMKPWNEFHVREFDYVEFQNLLNKYFSDVQILGLFAEEALYLIEKNRLDKARLESLKSPNNLKEIIKRLLPKLIKEKIRILKLNLLASNELADSQFVIHYTHEDFFYKNENLEDALDLLAICTFDSALLNGVKSEILKQ